MSSLPTQRGNGMAESDETHSILPHGRVEKTSFVRNALFLTGGTAVSQTISVAATVVIAHLYVASDLGQFSLYFGFLSTAAAVASLRFELAIVSAGTERDAAMLTIIALATIVPCSLIAAGVLFIFIQFSILGFGSLPLYSSFCLLPGVGATAAFTVLRYSNIRAGAMGRLASATVVQSLLRASGQVVLGLASIGWVGLLVGDMAGRFGAMSPMANLCIAQIRALPAEDLRYSSVFAVAWNYRAYTLYGVPSALIDTIAGALPLPIIISLYGIEVGGQFALAYWALSLPAALITRSIADTFHAELAVYVRANRGSRLLSLLLKTAGVLAAIGSVLALAATLFAVPIGNVLLGPRWAVAVTLIPWLIPWLLAQMIVNPLTRLVYVCDGQRTKFIYDLTSIAMPAMIFLWLRSNPVGVQSAVAALSIGNAFSYAIYLGILIRISIQAALPVGEV
jgi:O-antigen/teichoic acid export membrane protein